MAKKTQYLAAPVVVGKNPVKSKKTGNVMWQLLVEQLVFTVDEITKTPFGVELKARVLTVWDEDTCEEQVGTVLTGWQIVQQECKPYEYTPPGGKKMKLSHTWVLQEIPKPKPVAA